MSGRTWAWAVTMLALTFGGVSACDLLGGGDEASKDDDGKKKKSKKKASASDDDDESGEADDEKAKTPEKFEGKTFAVGDKAELAGLNYTVKKVKECTYDNEGYQNSMQKQGKKLLAAQVLFESTSKKRVHATKTFKAHDEDRIVFQVIGLGGTDCTPELQNTGLDTGDKAKGWIGFKVSKDAEGLSFTYEHQPLPKEGETKKPAKQYAEFELKP